MSELSDKQNRFLPLVGQLVSFAYSKGYTLRGGELWRSPEQAALNAQHHTGIANSLHGLRLAIDLEAYKNGVWLKSTEDYTELGTYWESLGPDCTWGGRFHDRPDGNHFSITWGGIR
jgi:D-alanyl-D-alanine carboxypeptidase